MIYRRPKAPVRVWEWRIPVRSRTKLAHCMPITDTIKREYQARCGVPVLPAFAWPAPATARRCRNCEIVNSYVEPSHADA